MDRSLRNFIRRAALLLMSAVLLAPGASAAVKWSGTQPDYAASAGVIAVVEHNGGAVLVNNADGYCLPLREGAYVDLSRAEAGVSVAWEDRTLDIYVEPLGGVSAGTYIDYSKRFLKTDPVDHALDARRVKRLGSGRLTVTAWHRRRLARVENDHPYYTCLDLSQNARVYTLLLKTDGLVSDAEIDALLGGFVCYRPTAEAEPLRVGGCDYPKSEETAGLFDAMFGGEAGFTWGFYCPDAPYDMDALGALEARLDHKFGLLMMYSDLLGACDPELIAAPLQNAWDDGRAVLLTFQAHSPGQVYGILNGAYDGFLRDYAKAVAAFGHPVLLRLFNEMNGDWCSYNALQTGMDPSIFRAAYSYVAGFFRDAGADNVLWVWNPNERAYPRFRWNHMAMYYPDEGCDLYGVTGYNTGTHYKGETWRSFEAIYAPICADAARRCDCPMLITEFACSDFGGDKAAWLEEMFARMGEYPMLRAAVWWNGTDFDKNGAPARQYRIDLNEEYLDGFRRGLANMRE